MDDEDFRHHRRALLAVSTLLLLVALGAVQPLHVASAPEVLGVEVSKAWLPWLLSGAWVYMVVVYHYHVYIIGAWERVVRQLARNLDDHGKRVGQKRLEAEAMNRGQTWTTNGFSHRVVSHAWWPRIEAVGKLVERGEGKDEEVPLDLTAALHARITEARWQVYFHDGWALQLVFPTLWAALCGFAWALFLTFG